MSVLGRVGVLEVAEPMADRSIPEDTKFLCVGGVTDIDLNIGSVDVTLEPAFCDKHIWRRGAIIQRNWLINVSGVIPENSPGYDLTARKAMRAWMGAKFFVRWYPFGKRDDGAPMYQGNAVVTTKSAGASSTAGLDYSLSIRGSGYLNRGIVEYAPLVTPLQDFRTHNPVGQNFRHHG